MAAGRHETGSKWKKTDWDRVSCAPSMLGSLISYVRMACLPVHMCVVRQVFAGDAVANHLFLRSGLIRKDLLPRYTGTAWLHVWLCPGSLGQRALGVPGCLWLGWLVRV